MNHQYNLIEAMINNFSAKRSSCLERLAAQRNNTQLDFNVVAEFAAEVRAWAIVEKEREVWVTFSASQEYKALPNDVTQHILKFVGTK